MRRFVACAVLFAVCLAQNQAVFAQNSRASITPTELPALTPMRAQIVMAARCDSARVPALLPPVRTAAYFDDSSGAVEDLNVEFDLSDTQQNLYSRILRLTSDPDHIGTCDNVALEVAGHALFYWDIQKHLRSALKNTADAVRDGAKLGGADTLAKVAEVAGELISAYDTDQPEAAIGRAIVNNSVDWAVDKAKGAANTGNEQVDEHLKGAAEGAGERARDRLVNGLFGGPLAPRITESTTIPELRYCSPTITFEFREPRGTDKGGLFLQVVGTCDCNNPNNQIKLRYFYVTMFLPLTRMDARVEWRRHLMKTALDIKDLMEKSHALKQGVEDSMKPASQREEGEEEPDLQQLSHDVAEAAGTASGVTPTLVLIPHFAAPSWEDLHHNFEIHSECGCASTSETQEPPPPDEPPSTPPPPAEPPPPSETPGAQEVNRICRKQCEAQFNQWKMEEADRVQICADYFDAAMAGRRDPELLRRCKNMIDRTQAARQAYYRCLEACYQHGVGAGLIPEVPHDITEGAHPPERPRRPETPKSVTPQTPQTGKGTTPACKNCALTPHGQANVLPDGAIYAEATIEPNSTLEVQQPGTALVENNGVTTARRVNPGDKLDPRTTRSVYFDNGSGLIVHVGRAVDKLTAMVGDHALTDGTRDQLPTFNNTVTTCVQSDRPFTTSAIATDGANHTPAQTNAVIRNAQGQKVGEFATYTDVKGGNVSIRTLDQGGATTGEAHVPGGTLSGTPSVAFDSPTYKEGQGGTLLIGNQQYYQAFIAATRFGNVAVSRLPIRFLVISDVRGIPPEVPFGTTSVRFTAGKAGQARVQVLMPGLSPPRPADPQNSNPERRQDSPAFNQWLQQFQPQ